MDQFVLTLVAVSFSSAIALELKGEDDNDDDDDEYCIHEHIDGDDNTDAINVDGGVFGLNEGLLERFRTALVV